MTVHPVVRTGPAVTLPAPFDVTSFATDAVVACAEAAAMLADARGLSLAQIGVDTRAVAAAFSSERHLRIDGSGPAAWAELSGFFATADGWVRLHGNYPQHAAAVRAALGLPDDAGRAAVTDAAGQLAAVDVETAVVGAGGAAAAYRSEQTWRASEQGRASGRFAEFPSDDGPHPLPPATSLPAEGLRVLDLTRVIAGPLAGRTLALWGADVLRIDAPDRPELHAQHVDFDAGKRSALLDLRTAGGAEHFRTLAAEADVLLLGYRPGALDRLGVGGTALLDAHPHLVVVELSAWGWDGPWSQRRGFDSLVQAACGIAHRCADASGRPGALPAQALDHTTGYRAAAAVLDAVRRRPDEGGRLLRLSLLGAGETLLALREPAGTTGDVEAVDPAPHLATSGPLRYARPPFTLDGIPMDHPFPARRYGADEPAWL
ncbi:MAG TPA: CoA transferase [Frankiaceae bacterium]|nr:CoA transferase [Frankiaceae bacterium]